MLGEFWSRMKHEKVVKQPFLCAGQKSRFHPSFGFSNDFSVNKTHILGEWIVKLRDMKSNPFF